MMNFTLKKQLLTMALVSIFSVALLGLIGHLLILKTSIGSEQSKRIAYAAEVQADVMPPSLYLIGPVMSLSQLTFLPVAERSVMIDFAIIKMNEFETRFERWNATSDLPPELSNYINRTLEPQARNIIQFAKEKVISAALAGDEVALNASLRKLLPMFMIHREHATVLTEMAVKYNADEHAKAENLVRNYELSLYVIAALTVLLVLFLSLYFSSKILSMLGADPRDIQSIANAIAQGNTDVDVPKLSNENCVISAMGKMLDTIKGGLDVAQENSRIKQALDATTTNIMIADPGRKIIYMNKSVERMLRIAEVDIRAVLPHFSVDKIVGSNMDIFHKNPSHQMKLLETLSTTYTSNIVVGERHFRLVANPIFAEDGARLGSVVEWLDRTQEVFVEGEVSHIVDSAALGNFTARVSTEGKKGFFLKLAEGLNILVNTAEKGLSDVSRVLGAMAKGDLTERIEADYSGTFGDLKNFCNETGENLTNMMDDIRTAAETIFTASSEIASGNADLSSRTEQQAANLEEAASSMEELTSTVRFNADNAKQANILAEQASSVAIDGGDLIQQVVTTMNAINESARKISDIIGVIDGIAFQTNILALNAAVEAARAGDQGRGFAVVASEVRTLAQRSANAAKDIKVLISDSVKKTEDGNSLVGKSGDTMKEIVTAIKKVKDIMAEIAAASVEQSTGIEEVSIAVSQMDEMTQQNAALVEEAAAAAESLQSQADQMTRSVAQFRLSIDQGKIGSARITSSSITHKTTGIVANSGVKSKKLSSLKSQQDDEWEQF